MENTCFNEFPLLNDAKFIQILYERPAQGNAGSHPSQNAVMYLDFFVLDLDILEKRQHSLEPSQAWGVFLSIFLLRLAILVSRNAYYKDIRLRRMLQTPNSSSFSTLTPFSFFEANGPLPFLHPHTGRIAGRRGES